MADETQPTTIDWKTAAVKDGRLTVQLSAIAESEWKERAERVIDRLQRPGSRWGLIEVTKKGAVRVADLEPGSEDDLRHFLESVVLQADIDSQAAEPEDDEESEEDRHATEAFRAFADDGDA
jgi:thiamine monophosphate kinase